MTKERLEQYPDICAELRELPKVGFSKRREELQRRKEEVERFVERLPYSRQRRVVRMRALEGLTWRQVAGRMGHRYCVRHLIRIYKEVEKIF